MNVLITGGNRGLGLELVRVFAESGDNVTTIIRQESAKQDIEQSIPNCKVLIADITSFDQLSDLVYLKNNKIDILINNAGSGSSGVSLTDTEPKEIENQFKVHCLGAYNVTKATYSALNKSKKPIVINISSRVGSMSRNANGEFSGKGFSYGYRIGKAAQNMLTQCLAQEFENKGFKVCALHPGRLFTASGAVDAHMTAANSAKKIYRLVKKNRIENGQYYCIESGTMEW